MIFLVFKNFYAVDRISNKCDYTINSACEYGFYQNISDNNNTSFYVFTEFRFDRVVEIRQHLINHH